MDTPPTLPRPAHPENQTGGRRRPSGEPPPLPRPVDATVRAAVLGLVGAAALTGTVATDDGLRAVTTVDLAVLRWLERGRVDVVTDVARAVVDAGSVTAFRVLAWAVLLALLLVRRFQHLVATLVALLAVPLVVTQLRESVGRLRPAGVSIVADWEGHAHPSLPVAVVALVLTVATLVVAPPGRPRRWSAVGGAALTALVIAARWYTAVDHPSDSIVGLAVGVAVPVLVIRLATPEESFPVTYRRGVRAHLDLGGQRGSAIRAACRRQLGIEVVDVVPFRLEGSAGSTPMRLETPDGPWFGKLYAAVHMRSDRWYKLARTVRYGRLEDERPFNSVRRLVQYEDYMLRVMRDAGVPTAEPAGIVEITPEREYVLVTGFIGDAVEIQDATVDDDVIDQALGIVRRMWDAGLAHRDIKPSNVLVADGRVRLIDVAFAEVRPSPWRQAVDLANMMLTLSLAAPPQLVYARAIGSFTPEEVAEAFAATRAVTMPSQLRAHLRAREGDLVAELRALAPSKAPVSIQRWTFRRVALTVGVVAGALVAGGLVVANLQLAGLL